jgi:hypothetical protein
MESQYYHGIFEGSAIVYTIVIALAFLSGAIATFSDPTDPIVKSTKSNPKDPQAERDYYCHVC